MIRTVRGNIRSHRGLLPLLLVLSVATGASTAHAQYLKAFLGFSAPNITDHAFDGTWSDLLPRTGEWGNFLLLDFVSSDPDLSVDSFKLDFTNAADASIASVYSWGHNPDGSTFGGARLENDVYTAKFTGLTDAVDVLIIHFDFNKPSFAGGGTPLGQDYIGATITAWLSDGRTLSGAFDMVDYFIAVAQIGIPGQPVDAWIRDDFHDVGDVPSDAVCPDWWTSPDIFIDNDLDDTCDAPVYGADNMLRAVVHNRGSGFAEKVKVDLYYRNSSTGLVFPDGALPIGSAEINVPPSGTGLVLVPWRDLPSAPEGEHWCIGAVLSHPDDPARTPVGLPYEDNNVGCANIWYIAGRAGERMDVSFSAGSGGQTALGWKEWPRDFALRVKLDSLPWKTTVAGVPGDAPFALRRAEEKKVTIGIDIPEGVKPHTAGEMRVEQVDVKTGKVVGGVTYRIYEDHRPPMPIRGITAMLGNKGVVLTWEPSRVEEETGLEEKVAYYEVFRNGQPYKKIVRDEDPFAYGWQWTDHDLRGDRLTYAVRAIDEGGNTSSASPDVAVTLREGKGLFNWLTWLLLILLVLLVILLIIRSRPARA